MEPAGQQPAHVEVTTKTRPCQSDKGEMVVCL